MLHCKIKTEKTDAGARNRLDAVLQGLVERSDSEREQNEEDSGKMVADSLSKDLSPSSAGKRPSSRFPQHRRKKRKEMDDALAETNQHKQNIVLCLHGAIRNATLEKTVQMTDMLNGKGQNVYRLPPPVSCPVGLPGEPVSLRIPPIEKPTESQSVDDAAGTSPLIFNHIKRWKKIRQKWKEASSKNQLRYSESIKILKEMYER
ncbi:hypothetical protein cypCar_00042630 [Cyprinus carpio]|nr:hypothetical protein cypCar_00042630 [Cyprinus carpio]